MYGKASPEDILAGDRKPFYRYCGAKILAEEAAWSFAEDHPELDLTTSASVCVLLSAVSPQEKSS